MPLMVLRGAYILAGHTHQVRLTLLNQLLQTAAGQQQRAAVPHFALFKRAMLTAQHGQFVMLTAHLLYTIMCSLLQPVNFLAKPHGTFCPQYAWTW
jgi:hypothetical protein